MKHVRLFESFQDKYYHASPVINRKSIEEHGLDQAKGISPWDGDDIKYPKGNYMWSTEKEAVKYALGLGDSFDIWEVSGIDVIEDPVTKGGCYSQGAVPRNLIKFVRTIKGVNDEE